MEKQRIIVRIKYGRYTMIGDCLRYKISAKKVESIAVSGYRQKGNQTDAIKRAAFVRD